MVKRERIIEEIIDNLRMLNDSSVTQEPYKNELFKLFAQAFNAGLFDRSAEKDYLGIEPLSDIIINIAPDVVKPASNSNWTKFYILWEEWAYAWRRADECRRRLGASAT